MEQYVTRYFLGVRDVGEFEVSKSKFVEAERAAGFRPRYGRPDSEPCTGGFSSGPFSGRMKHEKLVKLTEEAVVVGVHAELDLF